LVDRPCIPGAQIVELQKADGTLSQIVITPRLVTFGDVWAKSAPVQATTFARAWDAARPPATFGELWKSAAHPGFKAAQASIERREGVSHGAAGAILAAAARNASRRAKRVNPHLKRVVGHMAVGRRP
jgi:hypothetical protein